MWVRLDCTVASHRKLLRAGGEAAWFWVCGLAHANGHTTNGVIHRDDLVALYPTTEWTTAKRMKLVAKLVEVGLWDVIDADSWMIHDYADHQSEAMSEAVEARREREREKKRSQRSAGKSGGSQGLSPGDTHGDTQGSPPPVSPSASPGVSPPSDRPTVRPSDSGETSSLSSPPVVPPSGVVAGDAPPAETPARAAKGKRTKPAPTPDTIPLPGTLARRVFDAIVGDRALGPITGNPGDASQRWADPGTYPGVDVLAEVRRAGEYVASKPGKYTDGRAFLRGWLQRKADEVARMPKPAAQQPAAVGAARSTDYVPPVVHLGRNCKPLHRGA
jgi:hypothetical protein